ncbi:MAG: hypothetical protein JWN73_3868 [Betaproteobacteria bacterium]|nr:hypothetical protein [Betaproteobacteria bacterium]
MAATRVKELAERIYIDMVCKITIAPGDPSKTKPSPEAIAKLSFKLAEAFMKVDDDSEANAEGPKEKYEVQLSDIGG